jgi:hypothetical protein
LIIGNIYKAVTERVDMRLALASILVAVVLSSSISVFAENVQITNATSQCFASGTQGEIKVSVTNTGSSLGVFKGGITGTCGVAQMGESNIAYVDSGGSGEISIPITTGGGSEYRGRCTITITDVNSAERDSAQVDVCMTPPKECYTEGQTSHTASVGNTIYICENGKLVFYKDCQYGVVATNGIYDCAGNPAGANACTTAGYVPSPTNPCCQGLIVQNGVCSQNVEQQQSYIQTAFLVLIIVVLIVVIVFIAAKRK